MKPLQTEGSVFVQSPGDFVFAVILALGAAATVFGLRYYVCSLRTLEGEIRGETRKLSEYRSDLGPKDRIPKDGKEPNGEQRPAALLKANGLLKMVDEAIRSAGLRMESIHPVDLEAERGGPLEVELQVSGSVEALAGFLYRLCELRPSLEVKKMAIVDSERGGVQVHLTISPLGSGPSKNLDRPRHFSDFHDGG